VRDIASAYRLAIDRAEPGEVYNLATGVPVRIADVLDRLAQMAKVKLEFKQDPARLRPSDNPVLYGDASKFRSTTGWRPTHDLDSSLADTLDYWRDQLARG
ncbi:MAG TPA: GDP-mannose 4,6-dehydratase, partial [Arenicellales bacterium]|nr:GDP-mannose 4,6-dehydratase [Arenicellales bacterium]